MTNATFRRILQTKALMRVAFAVLSLTAGIASVANAASVTSPANGCHPLTDNCGSGFVGGGD